jgi:hypothetical protein
MNALERRLSIAVNLYSVSLSLEQVLQCSLNGRIVLDYKNSSQHRSGVRWISQSGHARGWCDLTHQNGQSPHAPILHSNMATVITKVPHKLFTLRTATVADRPV